jgi:hypothetical protein
MADIKMAYGSATAMTVTLAGLANGSARQTTEVDNSTNLFRDVYVRIKTNGQTSGSAEMSVYIYGSVGDTTRSGGAGASDAAFSGQLEELAFLGTVQMNVTTSVTVLMPSFLQALGYVPNKWGLVFQNDSGAALHATGGEHDVDYMGIFDTV